MINSQNKKINKFLFDIYIHTNKKNDVPAKVGKYTFIKYNPSINVYLKYLEDCNLILKNHLNYFIRDKSKLQLDINSSQSFFSVRFTCCEEHKQKKRKKRWILVIDPDIFCYKPLTELNDYILNAEKNNVHILACKKQGGLFNSSFMLLDTKFINWTEASIVDSMFNKKEDFNNYMYLNYSNIGLLPDNYNHYDKIIDDTKCYHTTKTITQPWKTGIKYNKSDLHNRPKIKNEKKTEIFKEHPNKTLKQILFNEFKEAYNNNYISVQDIENGIRCEGLRKDIYNVCDIYKKKVLNIKYENTKNKHLKLIKSTHIEILNSLINNLTNKKKINILNIGGGYMKKAEKFLSEHQLVNYYVLDISNHTKNKKNIIVGSITDPNLNIDIKFDIIYSKDTFEHILNPWDATQNILKLLNNNGYLFCMVPFSWRYHACPYDTYRYTHTGLRYLFERLGGMKYVISGYKYFPDNKGWYKSKTDITLDNDLFKKPIETFYISKRVNDFIFNLKDLDVDNEDH